MRVRQIALAAVLGLLARDARAYLTDREVRPPVNYFVLVPPAAGQSYIDPVFGTAIRRISDAHTRPNAANVGNLAFIANEYSTMSPFNEGSSRLILQHQSYFGLYDGDGRYLRDLPFEISASTEPRWSRHDPNLIYYLQGNRLKGYDVASGAQAVVRTFSEYAKVGSRGESDICSDGDHFVLVGDDREIFVYELSTDRKGPVLDASGHGFDSVYIAPGDQVIVSWNATGSGALAGIELYDRDMRFLRQLAAVNGHKDVARDTDGEAVLLWINAADPQAPADCPNGVVKIRLADAQRTCLLSLDWSLAAHVSAPDAGDWFFVSTYAPADPNPLLGDWRRHGNEVLQVRLDGSEVRRLAHHRSRPLNDYWYTPRAAVSRDGSRLVYTSNHGLPSILGYGSYYADTYLIDLTAAAASPAGSSSAIATRYEQDHPSVAYSGSWYSNALFFHSGASAALAVEPSARSRFLFSGTRARWIGFRDEWSGIARVFLDGQLQATVDTFATPFQAQATLFSASELPQGIHSLEIESAGSRNALSGGSWVWVDAFEAAVRTQQDDGAVSYGGAWQTETADVHSGRTAVRTMEAGARVVFAFSGRGVSWIGYRDASCGIARVWLDGAVRAEIDTFAAAPEAQAVVYTLSGLLPSDHTLAIEATGRRHPLSSGEWIWVDAFETLPE
jgi:hypothetical protein